MGEVIGVLCVAAREPVAGTIRRYLDNAHKSKLLRQLINDGVRVRGMLVSAEGAAFQPRDKDVTVETVDRDHVIEVLKRLRRERLDAMGAAGSTGEEGE